MEKALIEEDQFVSDISIVTVTFNNFDELVETIESVKDVANSELVIINGGSCEKTHDYLLNSKFRFVSEPDKGIADAFNKGVKMAWGKSIIFINSGDKLISKKYPNLAYEILKDNPDVDFVHSNEYFLDEISGKLFFRPLRNNKSPAKNIGFGMPYRHQTVLTRKSAFNKVGLFDLKYRNSMDYEWFCRWQKITDQFQLKAVYLDISPVTEMDGKGTSSVNEIRSISEGYKIIRKHFPYSILVWCCFANRFLFFLIRRTLLNLGLVEFLAFMKRVKHSENKK